MKMLSSFKNNLFLFYWFPVLIYCLLIFIQSSLPSPESLSAVPGMDKVLHFLAYAVLAGLFFRAFGKTPATGKNLLLATLLSIAAAAVYGISDEIHQHFVPSRNADVIDAIADIAGSFAGAIIYRVLFFRETASQHER
jgi:VanZ family protein